MSARRQRAAWLIFALALAFRLAFVVTLPDRLAWPDEREYVAIGHRLAAGQGFVAESYRSAPVLPVYLGLVFRAFGESYLAARIGQAVLGALTCVLVYRAASVLASPAVGALTATLLAVYPPHIYLAGVFYTACLESFLCASCVHLAARVLRARGGTGTAGLCGVALGLAVLTRPVLLALGPCMAAVWLWAVRPWRRTLAVCVALGLAAAATVLPWSVRNLATYGRFLLVSSGGGLTLWKGNNELADGTADDRFLGWQREVWLARLERLSPAERAALVDKYALVNERILAREREVGDHYLAMDDVLGPVARQYIAAEPARTLLRSGRKVVTLFSAFSPTETAALPGPTALVAATTFYPLLLLAVLGAPLAFTREVGLALPYLVVISMAAVHATLTSCTRFRLPVDPYVIMGASFTVVEILGPRLIGRAAPESAPNRPSVGRGAT